MPRVFVYEHVTAAGLGRDPASPDHSLFTEGRAMRDAVASDFARAPGVEVLALPYGLPDSERLEAFRDRARRADWSFVIAPETGGELERLARLVLEVGGRLLGPSPDAIALNADKLALAERWEERGVPTPETVFLPPSIEEGSGGVVLPETDPPRPPLNRGGEDEGFPLNWGGEQGVVVSTAPREGEVASAQCRNGRGMEHHSKLPSTPTTPLPSSPSKWGPGGVGLSTFTPPGPPLEGGGEEWFVLKPRDGCGSDSTFLVHSQREYAAALQSCTGPMIAQPFVPGRPASVAFLIGANQIIPLPPTFQRLSTDGRFKYEGGEAPIPSHLAARATALGRRAVACVPGLSGYVGVDLILGDAPDGPQDVAIEINPRLTTSYVGLRELCEGNLAAAMLALADGAHVSSLPVRSERVRWFPDGRVETATTAAFPN